MHKSKPYTAANGPSLQSWRGHPLMVGRCCDAALTPQNFGIRFSHASPVGRRCAAAVPLIFLRLLTVALLSLSLSPSAYSQSQTTSTNNPPSWFSQPMSLADCINIALKQNGAILRGKAELEASYGVVLQARAIVIPKLQANGSFEATDAIETPPFPAPVPDKAWSANIKLIQSIYEGGRISSSLRTARLTKEQAVLQYQSVIADALLQVRLAYYDVLLAAEQIIVQEASVKLLASELQDQQHRYDAGTVPRFNVLRADVELGNSRPKLIQARNAYRIAKNTLVDRLGSHVPMDTWEDIPLTLTDRLDADPYEIQLPIALAKALQERPELGALRKTADLRAEDIVSAKSGNLPSFQLFAGYGGRNSSFTDDPGVGVSGWTAGAQVSWNIFDGFLTRGKVDQAKSLHTAARVDVDNEVRSIELQVRTEFSNFIEAKETLESQKKVQEEAEEALRLAKARNEAGTGTQLDVLSAQTSLTQSRSTQVQALHDYDAARARLEHAIGLNTYGQTQVPPANTPPAK